MSATIAAVNRWVRFPSLSDPRVPFVVIMITYVTLGIMFLGFNRTPTQVLLIVGAACGLDFLFHLIFRRNEPLLFPLSAVITGVGLCILMNFSHGYWLPLVPVFLAIASKYLFTYNGRHVYNPSLFGIAISIIAFGHVLSVSPPQQWGGSLAIVILIVTAALTLFVFKIQRNYLIISFIVFYIAQVSIKAHLLGGFIPPHTVIAGTLTSPEFYLFTFFMFTDPATSPKTNRGQVLAALTVVLLDGFLQFFHLVFTLFLALFIYNTARLSWLHFHAFRKERPAVLLKLRAWSYRAGVIGGIGTAAIISYHTVYAVDEVAPDFKFVQIDNEAAGVRYGKTPGGIIAQVDPREAHMADWVLGLGDAVAVADVDGDGLQDFFLTNIVKDPEDRVALYLNKGNYRFERFPIPALTAIFADPKKNGAASGALFFDWNNDGAQDLVVLTYSGKVRFFENRFKKEGKLRFVNVTDQMQIDDNATSFSANALDMTRSGRLDLVIGHWAPSYLPGYSKPTANNIFNLPQPEYPGDRRMFNSMPNSLSAASNGGDVFVYRNQDGRFVKADKEKLGFRENRFVLGVGTGDINNDGWTDIYLADDFGPDQLLLNQHDGTFAPMRGDFTGQVGHDTYKGMNASLGDVRNTGNLDIYVSNAHVLLLREGSLFLMNNGVRTTADVNKISDRAASMNLSNEEGFGWGAAMGDVDLDGRLDILQTNGFIWNRYREPDADCSGSSSQGNKQAYIHAHMGSAVDPNILSYADLWQNFARGCLFAHQLKKVYLNRGQYFVNVADKVGWTSHGESRGIALVDLTNSGKLDAIVTYPFAPVEIYRNELKSPKRWAGLQLEGNGKTCNRDAAGTRVTIRYTVDGKPFQQMREVQITNGFDAQGDRRVLFGLGNYDGDITATIDWCGQQQQQVPLIKNEYVKVLQPVDAGTKQVRKQGSAAVSSSPSVPPRPVAVPLHAAHAFPASR